MDDKYKDESVELLESLPQVLRDFIYNSVWLERTDEIAKKYSLSEPQTESLINDVLFVLIGLERPENLFETIIAELNISRLLAEQIMEDLEIRVFEYAVKSMERKIEADSKPQTPTTNTTSSHVPNTETVGKDAEAPKIKPKLPELEPNLLPIVEAGEIAHDTKPQKNVEGRQILQNPIAPAEIVQRPVSVPRYTAVPIEDEEKSEQSKTESPPTQEVKKYAVDPYREPLE